MAAGINGYIEQRVIVDFDQLSDEQQQRLTVNGVQRYRSYEVVGVSPSPESDSFVLELDVKSSRVNIPSTLVDVVSKYLA